MSECVPLDLLRWTWRAFSSKYTVFAQCIYFCAVPRRTRADQSQAPPRQQEDPPDGCGLRGREQPVNECYWDTGQGLINSDRVIGAEQKNMRLKVSLPSPRT